MAREMSTFAYFFFIDVVRTSSSSTPPVRDKWPLLDGFKNGNFLEKTKKMMVFNRFSPASQSERRQQVVLMRHPHIFM
jgi:hypothetical protein